MMPRRVHAAGNHPRSAFCGSVSVAFALPLLLLLLWASLPLQAADRANKGAIRVGVFPFEPFNFLDKSGLAQGLNPDLLREIGREEGWTIEYVPGSWAEGLERLQREEIDLMVSVAHTPERAEIMDYTYEPVAELWGQVFVRPEGRSSNITDLAGRKVAVMRRDISGANFIDTAERFGIRCDIREYATHAEVFAAVRAGEAEAGVAPQHFGLRHARDYDLVGTTILFSPFAIYFTSKKGRHHELLSHIDAHLSTWKKDKDSIYYQKLSQWMGVAGAKHPFPAWLVSTFLAVVLAALVLGSLALYLRRAVRLKTRELRESEANYRFILDAMEESLLVIDTLGAVMFANERAARTLTGRGPEEIAWENITELLSPDEGRQMLASCLQAVETGQIQIRETAVSLPSGDRWFFNRLVPLEYGPYRTRAVLSISLDITERRQAEEALRQSQERFTLAMQAASDGLFDWDLTTNAIYYSPGWKQMLGYRDHELANDFTIWEHLTDPEDVERSWTMLREHLAGTRDRFELEFRMRHKLGHWVDILARANAVFDAAGTPVRVVGTHVDVTERNRAAEERKQLQMQLVQAQKMEAIGTLAGGIAHDFNNMLSAILGYAEMAREDSPQGSTLAKCLEEILKAGNRAKHLVRQILTFSRQTETRPILVDPAAIVREAVGMLRPSLPATIAIRLTIAPDVHAVLADPVQLHQIVVNLCTNAFHAMEAHGGDLAIDLDNCEYGPDDIHEYPDMRPGRFVRLSIGDTGAGITPEVRLRMFDPFFTTKETGKGTGMGLSTVHGIVKAAGGFITCDSEPGQGAIFRVFLPAMDGAPAPADGELIAPTGQGRILLVDDEAMLAEMGKTMLERLGYEVTVQTASSEALALFDRDPGRFDAVITDQTMPGLTGIELARRMLRLRPDLPIILCTGYSNQVDEAQAQAAGIRGFAMKPLAMKDLASLLHTALPDNLKQ